MTDEIKKSFHTIRKLADKIGEVKIMEVCGTHTVSLFRTGIKSMLPENINLLSGPGCPVCVTSQGYIDTALELTRIPDVIVCTYGDMIRVPGRSGSLEQQRAEGSAVKVVYSARDALMLAEQNPDKKIIWLAVGFETTAPTTAAAVREAKEKGSKNFFVLNGHKLAIPAMTALLAAGDLPLDGFLCPGHVSVIIGEDGYAPVTQGYMKPCVIAGFEPIGMVNGIQALLEQISDGKNEVENVYGVVVTKAGNKVALDYLKEVYEPKDSIWRAIGVIPESGLEFREDYRQFDALSRFDLEIGPDYDPPGCLCGEVIQGKVLPKECTLFANGCTPTDPVGPCMVSSEGTCAAWYKYGRNLEDSRQRL